LLVGSTLPQLLASVYKNVEWDPNRFIKTGPNSKGPLMLMLDKIEKEMGIKQVILASCLNSQI